MSTLKTIARKKRQSSNRFLDNSRSSRNRAGGISFKIHDPATKLITMTAGRFFAEPSYYSGDIASVNQHGHFDRGTKNLQERLRITSEMALQVVNAEDLDDVSLEIISTIWDVLNSDNPKDALSIANWLRNEMNIRLTPMVILVLASRHPNTQKYIRSYAPKIIIRPDEIKTCLLIHKYFFGMKTIKNCLSMGLSLAMSKFNERDLLKYNDSNFPKWKDVLCWIKRRNNWPISSALAKYFINGEVSETDTPVAFKRRLLSKKKNFDEEAKQLALESYANWEVLSSQFGQTPEGKKEVWSFLIENDLIGYMALMRNLRNILKANVEMDTILKACNKLSNRKEVLQSKQLPFRFFMAYKTISQSREYNSIHASKIVEALQKAMNISIENLPVFPGITVIFTDNSGSMSNLVSDRSKISCLDAANTLASIASKLSENSYLCAFGSKLIPIVFSKEESVMTIIEKINSLTFNLGNSTNTHLCIEWMMENKIIADRVILLSDMQCWDSNYKQLDFKCRERSFVEEWRKYKKEIGMSTWLHSVHINGYGDNPVEKERDKVNLIAGFSEKIFFMMSQAEGISMENGMGVSIPTLEQIRKNW